MFILYRPLVQKSLKFHTSGLRFSRKGCITAEGMADDFNEEQAARFQKSIWEEVAP
jgi:hypothetical protein